MGTPQTILANEVAGNRDLHRQIEDGEIELQFQHPQHAFTQTCYAQYVTLPDYQNEHIVRYLPQLASQNQPLRVPGDFVFTMVPARESVLVFEIQMPGQNSMICEDVPQLQVGLETILGEGNEWLDTLDEGDQLTISITSMSRKALAQLEEWEPS